MNAIRLTVRTFDPVLPSTAGRDLTKPATGGNSVTEKVPQQNTGDPTDSGSQ